jgi:hypothetical protein
MGVPLVFGLYGCMCVPRSYSKCASIPDEGEPSLAEVEYLEAELNAELRAADERGWGTV